MFQKNTRIRLQAFLILGSFLCLAFFSVLQAKVTPNPYSSIEIEQSLKKLSVLGSVLYLAAHPDDENTALLAWLAKDKMLNTAYLSLTRGGGGQNLIGSEKGAILSAIRSSELYAARSIDGGKQYFTRAVDFGYSKTATETLKIWDRESVLSDIVLIIRKLKPDLIITRFSPDRGGHGHHSASAQLAIDAAMAAADPTRYPDQLKELSIWTTKRVLWNSWLPYIKGTDASLIDQHLAVDLGKYNPLLGLSYMEIAARSRTMHKSQGFGMIARRGQRKDYFLHLSGSIAKEDIFEGIDLSWDRLDASPNEIEGIRTLALDIYKHFSRIHPHRSIPQLVQLHAQLEKQPKGYWIRQKQAEVKRLIRLCAGLWIEALSPKGDVFSGEQIRISVELLNRSPQPVLFKTVDLQMGNRRIAVDKELKENVPEKIELSYRIGNGYLHPHWLVKRKRGGLYDHDSRNLISAMNPYPYRVQVQLLIAGHLFDFDTPIITKWRDPVKGEQRETLTVLPPVSVRFDEVLNYFPSKKRKKIRVIITGNRKKMKGVLKLDIPTSWRVTPNRIPFTLEKKSDKQIIELSVTPPVAANSGRLKAILQVDGKRYDRSHFSIKYDHIPKLDFFPLAETKLVRSDIRRTLKRIGYVNGSGDDIPKYLKQLGYRVDILDDQSLSGADLGVFDTIIVGVRAYNTRDILKSTHKRLLNYVREGGRLLVQYNVSRRLQVKQIGPFPFSLSRRRVTEEDAVVHFLDPKHPIFFKPNRIKATAFLHWVQERGLYFADSWHQAYQTPMESHDQGEKKNPGGLLVCRYGKGTFVYTGYSFFRQIPAGVGGAFRLFVNLIEYR